MGSFVTVKYAWLKSAKQRNTCASMHRRSRREAVARVHMHRRSRREAVARVLRPQKTTSKTKRNRLNDAKHMHRRSRREAVARVLRSGNAACRRRIHLPKAIAKRRLRWCPEGGSSASARALTIGVSILIRGINSDDWQRASLTLRLRLRTSKSFPIDFNRKGLKSAKQKNTRACAPQNYIEGKKKSVERREAAER